MQDTQNKHCDAQEEVRSRMQKIEEEYAQLGKIVCRLVLDTSHRIDGYADEIIEMKLKEEGKDK